jgi:hypothetical protein
VWKLKRFSSWFKKIEHYSPIQKIALLLIIGLILYGSLIVIQNEVVVPYAPWIPQNNDIDYYHNRTSAIINGEIPYKDFSMESPPIIDYMMVPAQLMGGESWQYSLYFSLFIILTGILYYAILKRYDERLAFLSGLALIVSPFAFIDATFGVQDKGIVVFMFILPLLLFVVQRYKTSAFLNTLGIWTLFFNATIFPVWLIKARTKRARWMIFGITIMVTAAVAVPLLLIAPSQFISFPSYYLLQNPTGEIGGLSIWHFWAQGGYSLPGTLSDILTVSAILISSYYVYLKRDSTTFWEGCMIVLIAFFVFYPKINLCYYLLPISLLIVWGVENRSVMIRCFALYIPLILAACLTENVTGQPAIVFPFSWVVGSLIVLGTNILLIDTFIKARKRKAFFER